MNAKRESRFSRMLTNFSESFGLNRTLSLVAVCLIGLVAGFGLYWFLHTSPPRVITLTSGLPGSSFDRNAQLYRDILKRNGVTLKIQSSQGSLENLHRLEHQLVDVGFVQGGIADGTNSQKLVSLGSLAYQPLLVFYRSTNTVRFLSDFAGQRLAVGAQGSGTRTLALTLLQTNGITGDATRFLDLDAEAAAQALLAGTVDVVFLMSDSASSQTMRTLLRSPGVQLLSFEQADAYTRRYNYLNKLRLPEGAIDLGKNLPSQDAWLIGPTVELVARPDLNPAVSDLLLEAAQEVHGKASMFQRPHEFPAALEQEYPISADARRFYSNGKTYLYRKFPFWFASLISRMLVSFVPIVLLIPSLRMIPATYRWQMQLRLRRWYRKLVALERELVREKVPARQDELLQRLDEIERAVKHLKMPASFADQFYNLRAHIDYVRLKLDRRPPR
jgi:TRAP-type uncharacterized transport system substrate-binding protein